MPGPKTKGGTATKKGGAKPAESARRSAKAGASPRRAASRDGDTERRILDAARRVFTRRGSHGARMQEIAEEAGVNQALLHYYFRSKDTLALAVFREAASRLFPAAMRIMASEATIEARVEQFVHHYIDTVRESPFLPGYVLGELNFDPSRITALATGMADAAAPTGDSRASVMARLGQELARRAALGDFRPISPEQFYVNLAALCVFPFAARPMLAAMFGLDAARWSDFLDARRRELPTFFLNALRP